jgi:predicted NAD/FAD-binding protein
MKHIAIIGAELSELTLATQLAGIANITLFEKHDHVDAWKVHLSALHLAEALRHQLHSEQI